MVVWCVSVSLCFAVLCGYETQCKAPAKDMPQHHGTHRVAVSSPAKYSTMMHPALRYGAPPSPGTRSGGGGDANAFLCFFFWHLSCLQFPFIVAIQGQFCVTCTILTGWGGGCHFIYLHFLHRLFFSLNLQPPAPPPPPEEVLFSVPASSSRSGNAKATARLHASAGDDTQPRVNEHRAGGIVALPCTFYSSDHTLFDVLTPGITWDSASDRSPTGNSARQLTSVNCQPPSVKCCPPSVICQSGNRRS